MRNTVSSLMGVEGVCMPTASCETSLPFLATITTAPRKLPSATSFFSAAPTLASRCEDMPTVSGCAVGSGGVVAARAANETTSASQTSAARAVHVLFMAGSPPGGGDAYYALARGRKQGSPRQASISPQASCAPPPAEK